MGYIYIIHMPNMVENAEQEVGCAKQEVSWVITWKQWKTDKNLDPLGYLVSIHTPNMAEKAEQKFVSRNRKLGHISEMVRRRAKRKSIHMPNMAEKAKQ